MLLHARRSDYPDTRRVSGPTAVTGLSDRNRISCQARRPWVASSMDNPECFSPVRCSSHRGPIANNVGNLPQCGGGLASPRGAHVRPHRQEKYQSRCPLGERPLKCRSHEAWGQEQEGRPSLSQALTHRDFCKLTSVRPFIRRVTQSPCH